MRVRIGALAVCLHIGRAVNVVQDLAWVGLWACAGIGPLRVGSSCGLVCRAALGTYPNQVILRLDPTHQTGAVGSCVHGRLWGITNITRFRAL